MRRWWLWLVAALLCPALASAQFGGGPGFSTPGYNEVQDDGSAIAHRFKLNFISGTNTTITCVDNTGTATTDCTFSQGAGGSLNAWDLITADTGTATAVAGGEDLNLVGSAASTEDGIDTRCTVGTPDVCEIIFDASEVDTRTWGAGASFAWTFDSAASNRPRFDFGGGLFEFNSLGGDVDFRVDGTTSAPLLFSDAGNLRIGLGTNIPQSRVEIDGSTANLVVTLRTDEAAAKQTDLTALVGTGTPTITNFVSRIRSEITAASPSALASQMDFEINQGDSIRFAMRIESDAEIVLDEYGDAAGEACNGVTNPRLSTDTNGKIICVSDISGGSGVNSVAFLSTMGVVGTGSAAFYMVPGDASPSAELQTPVMGSTYRNLRCVADDTPGGSGITVTAHFGACAATELASTSLAVTVTTANTEVADTTDTIAPTVGQCVQFKVVGAATTTETRVTCSVERSA